VTRQSAQDQGSVASHVVDGVATVIFGHPKGNSLLGKLLADLAASIGDLGADDNVNVIALRSDGTGAFCAGASFAELAAISDVEGGTRFFMGFANLINAMRECPKLIVTRVHGRAVGGGVGIVAASDYALATTGAQVKLSELMVGIGPFVVGPVIERKIGAANYAALGIDAASWRSAEWAYERGLFAELHANVADLDTRIAALTSQLAASNPAAMAELKKVLWQGCDHWRELLPARARLSGTLVVSAPARQAIQRFSS